MTIHCANLQLSSVAHRQEMYLLSAILVKNFKIFQIHSVPFLSSSRLKIQITVFVYLRR